MADEMTRQEFKEFMAAFAQRLDTRFDRIDDQFRQTHLAFADLTASTSTQLKQTHQAFNDLKTSMNGQFTQTHQAFNDLKANTNAQFTQTHQAFNDLKANTNAQFTQTHEAVNDLKTSTNAQFTQTHEAVNDLKTSMNVQFEETRQHFKLSLEAVEGLRETTERGFAAMHSEHAEHKALLEQAIRHVRERLENVERYHPGA